MTVGECRGHWEVDYARLVEEIDARLELARSALDRVQIQLARELLAEVSVLIEERRRVQAMLEKVT